MTDSRPLSLAKISAPRPKEVYARRRLFRLLDVAAKRPMVWITGPAGAGKTTLIQSWLDDRRHARVWYQVDEGDADIAGFFHYLTVAADRLFARKPRLPRLSVDVPVGIAGFSRRFFEAFYARLPKRAVVVFDNYQEAPSGALDAVLRSACDAVRPGVTLVVVSRTAPGPALARALVSDDVALVDWSRLRMDSNEVRGLARLLSRRSQRNKRPARTPRVDVGALCRVTGGWAAGVVLLLDREEGGAGRRLDSKPPAELGVGLSNPQTLFDYFATELFDRTDEATQAFLLESALLPWMTERTAADLTGAQHAGAILTRLGAQSFFIERHGASPFVYQYHPLFRAFLLDRAMARFGPERLCDLRRRAGQVLVESEQMDAGLELLKAAGDWPAAASVILKQAPLLMREGRSKTLEAWLAGLPPDVIDASAWLLFFRAACSLGHDPQQSVALLDRAFAQFRKERDADGAYLAWSAAMQALVHGGMDLAPIDRFLELLEAIEREGLVPSPAVGARVATGKLMGLFRQPGHANAAGWTHEALELSRGSDESVRAMNGGLLIPIHCFSGDLARAATVLDVLRRSSERRNAEPLAAVTLINAEAVYRWATGDPLCLDTVSQGLALADSSGIIVWNDQLAAIGAAAALGKGDVDAAARFLARMADAAARGSHFAVGNFHFYAAWDALVRGDLPRARVSAEIALDRGDRLGYPLARVLARTAIAAVFARLGRSPEALRALRDAREIADVAKSRFLLFTTDLIEADVRFLAGDPMAASGALRRALELGSASGISNVFWWPRDSQVRLCVRALEQGIEPDYVRALVDRHGLVPDPPVSWLEAWPWKLRLRALGGFELEKDGVPVSPKDKGQRMPLRLLAALVALGGGDVREADLANAVWPDSEGDGGRRVLNTTLHRLRKLLGRDDLIRVHGGRVHLDARSIWLDTKAFERAAIELERALDGRERSAEDIELAAARLMASYRGPFLAGDDSLPIFVSAREKMHARFLRSVEAVGGFWEQRGAIDQALGIYVGALERDDIAETAYRRAMHCLDELGRGAEALRLYDRYRTLLGRQLGIAPSRGIQALSQRIRAGLAAAHSG